MSKKISRNVNVTILKLIFNIQTSTLGLHNHWKSFNRICRGENTAKMGPEKPRASSFASINTSEAPFVPTRMSNPSDLQRHTELRWSVLVLQIGLLKVTTWRSRFFSKFTQLHVRPASKTIPTIYHKMFGRIQKPGTPKNGFICELLPIVLRCTRFCFTPY